MGAGQPDWQKLHAAGKLPKDQRNKIGMLPELDALEAKIKTFEDGACDECRAKFFSAHEAKVLPEGSAPPASDIVTMVELSCETLECAFVAKGKSEGVAKNNLRLHAKSHEVKA